MERFSLRSAVWLVGFIFLALAPQAIADEWLSTEETEHPLAGKIMNSAGQVVDLSKLIDAAAQADYVLLGETHDNADHHRLQAQIISQLGVLPEGDSASVVFEMLNYDQQEEIDRLMTDPDPAKFGNLVGWETSGWPDWAYYQPIMEAIVGHRMDVIAGNPDRNTIHAVGRGGIDALDQAEQLRFGFDIALAEQQSDGLLEAVDIGHCGLMPKTALAPMVNVQRLKDGALANAMMSARAEKDDRGLVVLIAGSGHVRKDYAVPAIIRNREPDARIVAISFREVVNGEEDISDYLDDRKKNLASGDRIFDFVWFTPRAEREDPCEKLRQHLEGKG